MVIHARADRAPAHCAPTEVVISTGGHTVSVSKPGESLDTVAAKALELWRTTRDDEGLRRSFGISYAETELAAPREDDYLSTSLTPGKDAL